MFCVYFLKSLKNNDLYIGSCEDITVRLNRHNRGLVRSTKAYKPWYLVGQEEYNSRSDAVRRERSLKTGQQRELLKKKYRDF
ncbi:MAG: GIY-YIG nuclease family protein [Candidatus Doudnabacteria bacterium]|nr:GIY-YIG nuclease family protein [Candidatus Doudnabacteria bacterium]